MSFAGTSLPTGISAFTTGIGLADIAQSDVHDQLTARFNDPKETT